MNRLREIREDKDLTQREISELLKVSLCTYSYYESEKKQISLNSLIILATYFNTSIDYLLYLTDEKNPYLKIK